MMCKALQKNGNFYEKPIGTSKSQISGISCTPTSTLDGVNFFICESSGAARVCTGPRIPIVLTISIKTLHEDNIITTYKILNIIH